MSKKGDPMNLQFQEYNILRIAIARNDEAWLNEDLDIDPNLHLMENYDNLLRKEVFF
jgi:hypothetical protein